jgi:hypothetical protein
LRGVVLTLTTAAETPRRIAESATTSDIEIVHVLLAFAKSQNLEDTGLEEMPRL